MGKQKDYEAKTEEYVQSLPANPIKKGDHLNYIYRQKFQNFFENHRNPIILENSY